MRNAHAKNTVRYYILLIALLSFLFFSNDFGLIDVQKTAIVMATGIDREGEDFIVTAQIAVPKGSEQGKSSEAVQLVSRGKTVAEALDEINAKTGWYPKLVFCKLILLGQKTAEENVFDALDVFLRNEYFSDDCQIAVCEGEAKTLLNESALIDPSSSTAMGKVLSAHAERVGSVRPSNLKDFAIGYYGDSQSGVLPVLKKEEQQEKTAGDDSSQSGSSSSESASEGGSSSESNASSESGGGSAEKEKPLFSAKQTALFVRGRWVETLTEEETFALNAATGNLRLANYSVEGTDGACTLSVKRNLPKIELNIHENGRGELKISVKMVAGLLDYSKAQGVNEVKDMGDIPDGVFAQAEKKLSGTLVTAYEKARGVGCDLFGLQERLVKYERKKYLEHRDALLNNTTVSVKVTFASVR